VRRPWPREAVAAFAGAVAAEPFPVWPARRCVLYESRLTPNGAVHTAIQEWALAGGPATA
jgi:2'-5' RNA ligase